MSQAVNAGHRVFVTGATGNVGRPLVRALIDAGVEVTVGQRGSFDFTDPGSFAAALDGIDRLFLLRPPAISEVESTLNVCVDAALEAGVRQVVFLSVVGADSMPFIPHAKVEAHVRASAAPTWTFLRAGFFCQNLIDTYAADIRADDRIYLPAGRGRAAFVDAADLAQVAFLALTQPLDDDRFARRALTLTGPEALDFDAIAALLTKELGRDIHYQRASALGYYRLLRRRGLPRPQAIVVCALHVGLRFGQAELVDPTLAELLGRPAHDMAHWIHANRQLFEAEPSRSAP